MQQGELYAVLPAAESDPMTTVITSPVFGPFGRLSGPQPCERAGSGVPGAEVACAAG